MRHKNSKIALAVVLIIIAIVVFCNLCKNDTASEPTATTQPVEETPTTTEAPKMTTDEFMAMYGNSILDELRKAEMTVDYTTDGNSLTINTCADGLAAEFMASTMSGNYDSWNNMLMSMNSACSSIYQLMQQCEITDGHVMLNVMNDTNPDNILASSLDGAIVYNVADDFE